MLAQTARAKHKVAIPAFEHRGKLLIADAFDNRSRAAEIKVRAAPCLGFGPASGDLIFRFHLAMNAKLIGEIFIRSKTAPPFR
ncbi:MAG TPA: hypothetical protein VF023_02715, partial [Bryobacteraceae bacterium]